MKTGRKIKKYFKKHWRWMVVIILAAVFFAGTSSFNYRVQKGGFAKWASPDETANYIFAKLYGQTGEMQLFERYNLAAGDIMHPRSFRSDHGWLKPMSFLGLILLYGKIASLTSYKVLPYLTPAFAAAGLVYFYLLVKMIFGRRNAFLSVFLLASFPPFIYYSARSMFHNVLFTVLLIAGLYYVALAARGRRMWINARSEQNKTNRFLFSGFRLGEWREIEWQSWLAAAMGGGFLGLAVAARTSELLWIAPMLLILWLFNIKKVGATKLVLIVVFMAAAMLPVFYWNRILYGSYYFGGYSEMNRSIVNIADAGSDLVKTTVRGEFIFHKDLFKKIKDNIFYFGFHPRQSGRMFYYYFIKMFSWFFWPAFFGLAVFLRQKRKNKRRYRAYLSAWGALSVVLIFYYGSWRFHDNPNPASFTIGNSYTRYWLPVYLGAIPLAGFFILKLTCILGNLSPIKKKLCRNVLRAIIVVVVFYISLQFVLFGSAEGLYYLGQRQAEAKKEWSRILELTERNATIITLYHDKLFFPERKVIVGLFDDKKMVATYARLSDKLPLYYYNFTLPPDAIEYLNSRRLGEAGLQIKGVEKITPDFTLYRLNAVAKAK